jgi:hypothetical protein
MGSGPCTPRHPDRRLGLVRPRRRSGRASVAGLPGSGRIEARTGLRMMPTFPRSIIETTGVPDHDALALPGAFPKEPSGRPCSAFPGVGPRGRRARAPAGLLRGAKPVSRSSFRPSSRWSCEKGSAMTSAQCEIEQPKHRAQGRRGARPRAAVDPVRRQGKSGRGRGRAAAQTAGAAFRNELDGSIR